MDSKDVCNRSSMRRRILSMTSLVISEATLHSCLKLNDSILSYIIVSERAD